MLIANGIFKGKRMKQLATLTSLVGVTAALVIMAGCQTVATNDAELIASKKEFLLAQSGFKVITVTTPQAATGYQWSSSIQGFGCEVSGQVVLRVPHCQEG